MFDGAGLLSWNEYVKILVGLVAMVPPPVVLTMFLSLVGDRSVAEKKQIALVASVAFGLTLLVFTFFGQAILDLFGITIPAFRIAGGILLLLMALEMMRAEVSDSAPESDTSSSATSIGIVPLAIPIMAGPGAISTTIIFASTPDSFSHRLLVGGIVVFMAVMIFLSLRVSLMTGRFYGKTTITVSNRVMGLIIAAIAVEFMLSGLADYFPSLVSIQ